jgi:hypothetical protein
MEEIYTLSGYRTKSKRIKMANGTNLLLRSASSFVDRSVQYTVLYTEGTNGGSFRRALLSANPGRRNNRTRTGLPVYIGWNRVHPIFSLAGRYVYSAELA